MENFSQELTKELEIKEESNIYNLYLLEIRELH